MASVIKATYMIASLIAKKKIKKKSEPLADDDVCYEW